MVSSYSFRQTVLHVGAIIKTTSILFVLALAAVGPAQAHSNLQAMKNSAFSRFSPADQNLLRAQIDQAIASPQDGASFEWKSEKTRASGQVTALERNKSRGLDCRNLRIANAWGNLKDEGVYRFCKDAKGQWKLAGPVLE